MPENELEKHATPEARTAHIDLADWLIEFLEGKNNVNKMLHIF